MRAERRHLRRRAAVGAGLALALLIALAPPAEAQGIGLEELREMMRWERETFLLAEVLEVAADGDDRPLRYDMIGWWGGPYNRVWFKADGEQSTREGAGETELQLLYGRLISPFWDALVGVRVDAHYGDGGSDSRALLALGLHGLAPYWFELEPTFFVSEAGDLSADLTATYDLLLTNRVVLQPRFEMSAALQEVAEFGVGSGLNEVGLGLRARYEIRPELAPYAGVSWSRSVGETADMARAAGERVRDVSFVIGIRAWR